MAEIDIGVLVEKIIYIHKQDVDKNSSIAVEKSRRLGEVATHLKEALDARGISWHPFIKEELPCVSPASLYNAMAIYKNWTYLERIQPESLREAIRFIYPAKDMMSKYRAAMLDKAECIFTTR